MTRNEVLYKVIAVIKEEFAPAHPEPTETSRLYEDLEMDSLDTTDAFMNIQTRLGVKICDFANVPYNLKTVGQVVDYIYKELNISGTNANNNTNAKQLAERKFRIKKPKGWFDVHIPSCQVNLDNCPVYKTLYPLKKSIKVENLPYTNGDGNTVQQNRIEVEIPDIETITWSNIYRICNECKKNKR